MERLIEGRARVRVYWVHLVFAGIVLLGHLQFWWLFWSSRQVEVWSFFPFVVLLLQPILLYLLAGLCFPEFPEERPIDLREFYFRNPRWFFGLFALLMLLINLRDLVLRSVPWLSPGNVVTAGVLLIAVIGAVTSRLRVHAVLAIAGAAAMLIGLFTFGLELGG